MNRMSCNGCRVLRKGCGQDCQLRPCLQWIKSPESQANATLFLAKFYGRAGLINLISAGPHHLRPEIFKSLFYEACGRIIDPVYGSVGLMSSGNWQRCQEAAEAVLQGSPLMMQAGQQYPISPLQRCDIRHLTRDSAGPPHRVRTRSGTGKRSKSTRAADSVGGADFMMMSESEAKFTITGWDYCEEDEKLDNYIVDLNDHGLVTTRTPSQNSFSVETVEAELVSQGQPILGVKKELGYLSEIGLELTLGLNPLLHTYPSTVVDISDGED